MRIAIAAAEYTWPGYTGGIKSYTKIFAQCLSHLGHEVHIISTAIGGKEQHYWEANIQVHCVEARRILPVTEVQKNTAERLSEPFQKYSSSLLGALHLFRRSLRIREEVLQISRHFGLDIVEVPDWGAEGLFLSLVNKIPLVVTLHGPRFFIRQINKFPRNAGAIAAEYMEKQAILQAKVVISPSSALRRKVAQEYHAAFLEEKIFVIPNFVDTSLFRPNDIENQQRSITVTYVGRLQPLKGVQVLADAVPLIKQVFPEARFKFIGLDTRSAPDGGSMRDYLCSKLKGYLDSVEFTGAIPNQSLPKHFANSAVVVIPSFYENFPYTCAEAMASGACIVASRAGGLEEMIADGETGSLISPGDSRELAQAVIELLRKPEKQQLFRANARAYALEHLSAEQVVAQKLKLYEQVLL